MSFARHSRLPETPGFIAASGEQQRFCAEVADGLHALAQPLSILRSAIELIGLSSEDGVDRRRYVDLSSQQIERTSRLFASIQSLVASKLEPARCAAFDLLELLTPVIDERKASLQELGVGIAVANPDLLPAVLGDPERTEQAIAAILETAVSIASRGDVIEVCAYQVDDFVEITVHGARQSAKPVNAAGRLDLSVARESILSQKGRYDFCENPFCVAIALPAGLSGAPDAEKELCAAATN
jgi:light-regulated signal transduction histidine kinase (bacteriophytochrome)